MAKPIPLVVGFDQREAVAYHVFCQSVITHSSKPIQITPLSEKNFEFYKEKHSDGSNHFIYSRFLTPFLMGYQGWAIYADGDMVCQSDISNLWNLREENKAVLVVKHSYQTIASKKYLGNINVNYPRKNWSSLILWNCGHPKNKILTPDFVEKSSGSYLHRFSWLNDSLIGELPLEWNWLALEYPDNYNANIIHYTLGTPCFKDYSNGLIAGIWFEYLKKANEGLE